jgi:hypothetical protein
MAGRVQCYGGVQRGIGYRAMSRLGLI